MIATRSILFAAVVLCGLMPSASSSLAFANGEARGSITLEGDPLVAGKVTFHQENGQFVGCKVKSGKFFISRIPAGTLKVTLEGKGVPLAYVSDETSPLTVQVHDGPNRFDFELKKSVELDDKQKR